MPRETNATLIIALRHNDHMYVASDGVISDLHKQTSGKYIKCFPASDTSCVAISGYGGADGTISTISNQITFDLRFPQKLERLASEEYAKHPLYHQSLSNILDRFSTTYSSYVSLVETNASIHPVSIGETDIYFIGYDTKSAEFCQTTARFAPNAPHTFDLHTVSVPASSINFMGETGFLSALMSGKDPRINFLKSETLAAALSPPINADNDLEAKTICGAVLQLYALHTKYSKRLKYDDGLVGPPYVIYRVSTNNVTRIYYGNGMATSDEKVLATLLCAILFALVGGILLFALKA